MDALFERTWNVIAAAGQVPRGVDLARDLAGGRVVLRDDGEGIKAYRDGAPVRCETAFGLVFVHLAPGARALREDLALYGELDAWFSGMALREVHATEHDVCWTVIVENPLDAHTDEWLEDDVRFHDHVVAPTFTQYRKLASSDAGPPWLLAVDRLLFRSHRLAGYTVTHLFPNNLITWSGFGREWVVVEPLGPAKTRRVSYRFFPDHVRGGALGRRTMRWIEAQAKRLADYNLGIESRLWERVQRTGSTPLRGAHQRRIAAFQSWLAEQPRSAGNQARPVRSSGNDHP
jgi:phenylpropionate dioxygenase-like ring-hydroxylating dioxygenase large terminal subunit